MKKLFLLIVIFLICISCNNSNSFTATSIINGKTIMLSNGITIDLLGVDNNQANIKILNYYLKGTIFLYDQNNDEIRNFLSERISAIIYNSDGDCINELLLGFNKIAEKKEPIIIENPSINQTSVKFEHYGGVLKIPVTINGVELYFIFDTGAAYITISEIQAVSLYNSGCLTNIDIIGKKQLTDANGDISEGLLINLGSVIIGNRELKNVKACVIEGQNAPLLFGQSALQIFGEVSIDYVKSEITFK